MPFPIIPAGTKSGGYTIAKSLRFRSSASAYLSRTPSSSANPGKFTVSFWTKLGAGTAYYFLTAYNGTVSNATDDGIVISSNQIYVLSKGGVTGSGGWYRTYTPIYRDPSAWYHVVVAIDMSQSTNATKVRTYVNGVEQTAYTDAGTFAAFNYLNTTNSQRIGQDNGTSGPFYSDQYLAEYNFVDGQQLTASDFGQTDTATGVWMPKAYTGTYGTNGFYLNFSDASAATATTIGKDSSGNGNNWTPNNISVTAGVTYDSMVDTPTNWDNSGIATGNYCVWNPVNKNATLVVTDGNLSVNSGGVASAHRMVFGSLGFTTPCYFEITTSGGTTGMICMIGAGQNTTGTADGVYAGSYNKSFANGYATNVAGWYVAGVTNANGAAANLVDGTWGFAVDPVNGKAWVRNTSGSWIGGGDPAAGTSPTFTWTTDGLPWFPIMSFYNVATTFVGVLNAGQRSYAFTAPTGFKSLCTQNLPTPTIGATSSTLANKYFDISLWTGNASYPRSITGLNFQPDFLWIKSRSNAYNHTLMDVIRGTGNLKWLASNLTDAEGVNFGNANVTSLNSDGFTIDTTSGTNILNASGVTNVAWQWKANGSGSSNTSGSITSTVSANVTAGFSVVTYTGTGANATVGHGLGVAPALVIVKDRTSASANNWAVWHSAIANTQFLILNTGAAPSTGTGYWNSTSPTSTVFSVGTSTDTNASAHTYVAYCFTPVSGFSSIGSFTGNGSADGTFVYLGFKPKYILIKSSAGSTDWEIMDTARSTYNVVSASLIADGPAAEASTVVLDVLSNGFKLRTASATWNGATTIYYVAFADAPFKYSRAF